MSIRRHVRTPAASPLLDAPVQRTQMEECLEDPVSALIELQDEQRLIADELEDTFLAYDRKLQAAAKRMASLGSASVTPEERERLRAEQLELWRLVRRAQAAGRSTRELVREVREWHMHEPTVAPEGHPDHPETRVEIIESELRVRGIAAPTAQEPVRSASDITASSNDHSGIHWLHRLAVQHNETPALPENAPEWEHDTDEHLLREIYQQEQELTRTDAPADIADLLRSLRALHGHLRLHDRRHGKPRLRWRSSVMDTIGSRLSL